MLAVGAGDSDNGLSIALIGKEDRRRRGRRIDLTLLLFRAGAEEDLPNFVGGAGGDGERATTSGARRG